MAYGVKGGCKGKVAAGWAGAGIGAWAGKNGADKDITARYLLSSLPEWTTEDSIRMYFGQFSGIENVTVKARNDGQIAGSVKFLNPSAELRHHMLDESHELDGQPILVETWKMQKLKRPGYAEAQEAKRGVNRIKAATEEVEMEWQLVPQLVPKGSTQGLDPWAAAAKGFGKTASAVAARWSGELDASPSYGCKGSGKNLLGAGKSSVSFGQAHGAKAAGKNLAVAGHASQGQAYGAKGASQASQAYAAKGAGKSSLSAGQAGQAYGAKGAGKSSPSKAGQGSKGTGKTLINAGQAPGAAAASTSTSFEEKEKDITARYLLVDLDPSITEEELSNYFGTFGLIEQVSVKLVSGGTKITGSVKFIEPTAELRNIMFQQAHEINGCPINVQTWKMQKLQRPGYAAKVAAEKAKGKGKGKGKGVTQRWSPY